jgi:hypothetical protein
MTCDSSGIYTLRLLNYENIIRIWKNGFQRIDRTKVQDTGKYN